MRHAWKIQGQRVEDLPWRTWTWPWGAYWGVSWCVILIIAEFYLAVWPLGKPTTAEGFFSVYVSVIAIIVIFIGAKMYFVRSVGWWWVDASKMDIDAGRRFYRDEEIEYAEKKNQSCLKKGIVGIWS